MPVRGLQLLLCFAAGVLIAPWLPVLPPLSLLLAMVPAIILLCFWRRARLVAAVLLGGLWFLLALQAQLGQQWPEARAGELMQVHGTVVDLPRQQDDSVRFLLRTARGQGLPRLIQVRWYRPSVHIQPGSRWQMELMLNPPAGRLNPGGWDYQRHLLARRIGATAQLRGEAEQLNAPGRARSVDGQRQRLADILQSETADLNVAALKRALAVADRSGMPPELTRLLQQTGTAHLLAISGLHVGMVAMLFGLLGSWLSAPLGLFIPGLDRRRGGLVLGLLAAGLYAALAGFTLPTQRALIMLAAAALALVSRRAIAPAHALLLALLAVLLFDPLAPLDTGFWLSFAAVGVLIWTFAWRPGKQGGWLSGLLRAQGLLFIGLLPFNIGVFGQLVPAAMVANLFAIPLTGLLILPALLVDLGTMLLGLPSGLAGRVTDGGLQLLIVLLEWVHGLPGSVRSLPAGPVWAVPLAALGALWLIAPRGWPARWLGAVLLLPLLFPAGSALHPDELEVWFLDVGSGLSVLVRSSEELLMYDTGPGDGQGRDVISSVLPPLLQRLGASRIDRLILSHAHQEHAGGRASVLPYADRVFGHGLDGVSPCNAGQSWTHGSWRFEFLHPSPHLPDLGRDSSCVLWVHGPGGSLLLTGGAGAAVERRLLLQDTRPPTTDVLLLGRSGHRDATGRQFLAASGAAVAVASVGRHDRWGRVHPELRARLDEQGLALLETGRCGAIRLRLRPEQPPQLAGMAAASPRMWRTASGCAWPASRSWREARLSGK